MNELVSIVIPVYNGEKYINECINSIVNQDYGCFELIIIDDFSTDNSLLVLYSISKTDKRIRVYSNTHKGIVYALNLGIQYSKGKYIIRMDIDDIMHNTRLTEQIDFMENNKNIIVCSSWATAFGKSEYPIKGYAGYIDNALARLLYGNYIIHPSVIIRKDFLIKNKIYYNDNYPYAEDYKLWFDIARNGGGFYTLPKELIFYRLSDTQSSVRFNKIQSDSALAIKNEILDYLINNNFFPDKNFNEVLNVLIDYNNKGYINDTTIFTLCAEIVILKNSL